MDVINSEEYNICEVQLDQNLSQILPDWKKWNVESNDDFIFHDSDWVLELYRSQKCDPHVFLLRKNSAIIGVLPFILVQYPLRFLLGEIPLAKFPLLILRIEAGWPNIPDDSNLYEILFNRLIAYTNKFDAIYLEGIRFDSFFWKYINNSELVNRYFRIYIPKSPSLHLLIHMTGSFDDYMQKFSRKTRYNRLRELKILREQYDVKFVRVTEPQDVDAFVNTVAELSKKTWQYNLLGSGIRESEFLKQRLRFIADHGWLRSYLLKCNGVACSFIIGYQDSKRFHYIQIGYDQSWAKFNVGNVLLLLVLEDLYNYRTPQIFDLGSYGEHKKYYANDNYMEIAEVYLFRRQIRTYLIQNIHHFCSLISEEIKVILDSLNLKGKIKRVIRTLSVSRGN